MPLLLQGRSERERGGKAQQALHDVGLAGKEGHRPGELSGGEQQRVAVARALVTDPDLLLADEPTGNLDRRTGEQLMDLMFRLSQARSKTLIFVTHNEELAQSAQRQLTLADGKLN
jgi:predicted ABC-type transport system involved in lysophospholipase L1 biosynthesis ATPase subunit